MKHINFSVLISLIILISSCGQVEQVEIKPYNFKEEIGQFQNLEFIAKHEVFPDSILNRWVEGDYINIEPPVQGRCKFINKKTLLFSPIEGFKPSSTFEISLGKLPVESGQQLASETFVVHTPWFKMEKVQAAWTQSDDNELEVVSTLIFNYPISVDIIKDYIEIRVDGDVQDFSMQSIGENKEHIIKVSASDWDIDVSHKLEFKLLGSMKYPGSDVEIEKDQTIYAGVPARERFMVAELRTDFDEGSGVILVYTSQPVAQGAARIKELINISPQLEWSIEKHGQGFRIMGDFQDGKSYEVKIDKQLKGAFDRDLREDYKQTVSFGQKEPYLALNDKSGYYLSSKGDRNLGFTIINIPEVEVSVFRIYENNILQYFRNGKKWDYEYIDGRYHDSYNYPLDKKYGDLVYQDVLRSQALEGQGNVRYLNLDLEKLDYKSSMKGLYLVKVASKKKQWLNEIQLVSLSDIGLIVKQGKNSMLVFANSIKEAKPLADVQIDLISTNNQNIHRIKTNAQGVAVLDDMKSALGDFRVGMITASKADDYNFLILDRTRVETSRYDVGGKYINDLNYDMFVYGDRDLYRPGDSAHFNIITRTKDWKSVRELPLKIKVITPNGKILYQLRKQLDDQGAVSTSVLIPTDVMTGRFNVQVYSANDVLIQSYSFMVEEFMPDRISVKADLNNAVFKSSENVELNVLAMNLYGTPAAQRNYEVEMVLNRTRFRADELRDYSFDISLVEEQRFERVLREGKTDSKGEAELKFELPSFKNIGQVHGKIFTTVFDETGRPVNRQSSFELNTQDVFLGIKNFDRYVDTRKQLQIPVVAVDKDGNVVNSVKANVEVWEITWETVMERRSSSYYYRSQEKKRLVASQDLNIIGKETKVDFTPMKSGRYEIWLKIPEATSYVKKRFYAYGWGDTDYSSFEVDREGRVDIDFDRDEYNPGDVAKVLFKAPYDGQLLVTVEQDEVLEHHYLETQNKAAMLELPLKKKHMPNVYVSATAIRKIDGSSLPLTVAHGYGIARVKDLDKKLEVRISAPEKVRSKSKQSVRINTKPGCKMSIAVVDEGILQITGFQTPDPFEYFYQKRALGVKSFDLYEYLLPELMSRSSSASGGAGYDMSKRVNPFVNERVKLIAHWSGIVESDSKGHFEYTFDIPRFSGALRVMAVCWDDDKFGVDSKQVKVADPLVMSTALPRFLSPGDKVLMPVILSNTTDKAGEISVKVETDGNLSIQGEDRKTVTIDPKGEVQAQFWLNTSDHAGTSEIRIIAEAFDEVFDDQVKITIRPTAGLQKYSQSGIVRENKADTLITNYDLIPSTVSTKVVLSNNPMIEMTGDLKELIGYPYGCLEQTTSKAFPQIYIKDILKSAGVEIPGENPDYYVQQAIYKVQGMLRYDGSFSYWPGGHYHNWWSTVYATHFLMEASEAGFEVNQKVLNKAKDFIRKEAKNKEERTYYFYDATSKSYYTKRIPAREIFYSLFLQALDGKPDRSLMNFYKRDSKDKTIDSRYMLAASYALIGDRKSFKELLPNEYDESPAKRMSGGSFGSHIRNKAIVLYALLKSDPDNLQIPYLVKSLKTQLKNARWLSTQERVFSILAMAQLSQQSDIEDFKAQLIADDEIFLETNGETVTTKDNMLEMDAHVSVSGSGNIYYYYECEGVGTKNEFRNEDSHLKARKKFFSRNGRELTSDEFKQNDLIIVELSLHTTDRSTVENVVITDMLPACFEIENPRLTGGRDLSWIKEQGSYDYMDIRDDRINYFVTANYKPKRYYYQVRVVSKGKYIMGAVSADAMYDGDYYSYSGGGVVTVN